MEATPLRSLSYFFQVESMKYKGTTFPKSVASKSFWPPCEEKYILHLYIYIWHYIYIRIFMKIKCKLWNSSWDVLILKSYSRETLNLASKYLPQRCWWMYPLGAHFEEHKSNSISGLSKTQTWAPRKLFPLLSKTQFKDSRLPSTNPLKPLRTAVFAKTVRKSPQVDLQRSRIGMWTAWEKLLLEVV